VLCPLCPPSLPNVNTIKWLHTGQPPHACHGRCITPRHTGKHGASTLVSTLMPNEPDAHYITFIYMSTGWKTPTQYSLVTKPPSFAVLPSQRSLPDTSTTKYPYTSVPRHLPEVSVCATPCRASVQPVAHTEPTEGPRSCRPLP
jgi:hypothetical protein